MLLIGNEMNWRLVPDRLDMSLAGLYGRHTDKDNTIAPSDHNRTYYSTVLRLQTYATPQVHFLLEGSFAQEMSQNGNRYRNSVDSVFQNTGGVVDSRGLEMGDSDTRTTVQGKGGVVLNPLGQGIYVRPSLRLLYGIQWSSQNNAFGNNFVESLDQYNDFGNVERHLHHVWPLKRRSGSNAYRLCFSYDCSGRLWPETTPPAPTDGTAITLAMSHVDMKSGAVIAVPDALSAQVQRP